MRRLHPTRRVLPPRPPSYADVNRLTWAIVQYITDNPHDREAGMALRRATWDAFYSGGAAAAFAVAKQSPIWRSL